MLASLANLVDHLGGGRAAVKENNVILFDQGGRQRADPSFLFGKPLCPLWIFRFEDHPLVDDRSPMSTFEDPFLFQPFQVPSHGRFGSFQDIAQVNCANNFITYQIFLDSFSSLCWNKRFAH